MAHASGKPEVQKTGYDRGHRLQRGVHHRVAALEAENAELRLLLGELQGQIDDLRSDLTGTQQHLAMIELMPGPEGPAGPQGPPGPPGTLNLAGEACPEGDSVIGFDVFGELLCTGDPLPPPPPTSGAPALDFAPVETAVLDALAATDGYLGQIFPAPQGFEMRLVGIALCDPGNLDAPPTLPALPGLTVYGCPNQVELAFTNSEHQATIRMIVDFTFADLELLYQGSALLESWATAIGSQVDVTVDLASLGDGTWQLGGVSSADVQVGTVDMGPGLPAEALQIVVNAAHSTLNQVATDLVESVLPLLPPLAPLP